MASGYTSYISGSAMGGRLRFYYSTSYDAATNRSTVSVSPQLYVTTNTGGTNGYGGDIYGNGSSLYSCGSYYFSDYILVAANGADDWHNFSPSSGSISSFTVAHDNSGRATFTLGSNVSYRAMYDGTTGKFSSTSGISVSLSQSRTLNVSYNANGGSGAPSATYFYGTTESITLSSTQPTRTGYTFLGWSTSSTATTAAYSAGQNIGTRSSGLALYAVWQINTYTISFDANGGEGAPEAVTKTHGVTLTLPDTIPTRAGYDFLGWSADSSAATATYQAGGNYTANAAATLYAVWRVLSFTLSATISDRGITANILRTASPIGGAASGLLANGDTIYYGDAVKVSWALGGGYQAETLEIDGVDVSAQTEQTVTVTHALSVILVVELGAMVYISNDMYQVFINDGTGWSQYQAFIGNGSSWEAY